MENRYLFKGIVSLLVLIAFIGLAFAPIVVAQLDDDDDLEGGSDVKSVLACMVCKVFNLIFYVAAAISALVIVVAGIKWIGSGDDPSARGSAKSAVVHAIIGLVIVIIAVYLVWWIAGGVIGTSNMQDPSEFLSGCSMCVNEGGI